MNIKTQKQFLGNYRGIVKQHGTNGLCKIYVPDVYPKEYADVPSALPDAEPCQPLIFGGGDSGGAYCYPDIDSVVWLFFQSGDINYPVFFGSTNQHKEYFKVGQNILIFGNVSFIIEKNKVTINSPESINLVAGAGSSVKISSPSSVDVKGHLTVTGVISGTSSADITGPLVVTGAMSSNSADITTNLMVHGSIYTTLPVNPLP